MKSGCRGGNRDGDSPHCGFRRYIQETSVLTLQIKFAYSLNSLKYQLSQSKLFGQALRIIAATIWLAAAAVGDTGLSVCIAKGALRVSKTKTASGQRGRHSLPAPSPSSPTTVSHRSSSSITACRFSLNQTVAKQHRSGLHR